MIRGSRDWIRLVRMLAGNCPVKSGQFCIAPACQNSARKQRGIDMTNELRSTDAVGLIAIYFVFFAFAPRPVSVIAARHLAACRQVASRSYERLQVGIMEKRRRVAETADTRLNLFASRRHQYDESTRCDFLHLFRRSLLKCHHKFFIASQFRTGVRT